MDNMNGKKLNGGDILKLIFFFNKNCILLSF